MQVVLSASSLNRNLAIVLSDMFKHHARSGNDLLVELWRVELALLIVDYTFTFLSIVFDLTYVLQRSVANLWQAIPRWETSLSLLDHSGEWLVSAKERLVFRVILA